MELIKVKIEFFKSWVTPQKSWAACLKSWVVGLVGQVGQHFWPPRWKKITAFFRRKSIDEKIRELHRISDQSIFIRFNSAFGVNMYFVENPFTEWASEVVPVGFLEDGFEQALDTALMYINGQREKMEDQVELSLQNSRK